MVLIKGGLKVLSNNSKNLHLFLNFMVEKRPNNAITKIPALTFLFNDVKPVINSSCRLTIPLRKKRTFNWETNVKKMLGFFIICWFIISRNYKPRSLSLSLNNFETSVNYVVFNVGFTTTWLHWNFAANSILKPRYNQTLKRRIIIITSKSTTLSTIEMVNRYLLF